MRKIIGLTLMAMVFSTNVFAMGAFPQLTPTELMADTPAQVSYLESNVPGYAKTPVGQRDPMYYGHLMNSLEGKPANTYRP